MSNNNFQHFMGTKPLEGDAPFDVKPLEAYLTQHLAGFSAPLSIEQFKGGQSNPTFKLITPKAAYVMRVKPGPVAKLLPSAHAIEREYKVMKGLGNSDVPVPQMLLLCEDEAIMGRAFYVMSFVQGRVLWDQALPDMSNVQRGEIYDEMNRVIAALHKADVQACGLSDYGKPGSYFERQIARWSKQYKASVSDTPGSIAAPVTAMEKLIDWLPAHMPASAKDDTQVSIVHGDYRMDNLVFHPVEPRVLAVLDWELSTLGHPLADFSYHCMSWHIPPGSFRGIGGLDVARLGIPSERDYMARYVKRMGRDNMQALLADWNFYMAYNLFRISGILQGIAKRVEDGTASSAQAKQAAMGAKPMAEMGWQFAQQST
jgi:aminoglycoside phosphotransferase (APT) family kinase protein